MMNIGKYLCGALAVLNFTTFSFLNTARAAQKPLTLQGDHGKLAAVLQTPDGKENYPMVMLLHGFTSSKDDPIMTSLANQLEQRGIGSIRIDFNGHGASEGRFQDMTIPNEIEDAKHLYAYVKTLPQVTKVAVAGHSQGGVVTSMLAGELGKGKLKAEVLLSPAAVLRDNILQGVWFDLRMDPENPPETVSVLGHTLGRNYIETAKTLPIYETARKYTGPVCIIQGTGDVLVPYTYAQRYHDYLKHSELHLLKGYDHSYTQDVQAATKIAADFLAGKLK